MNRCTTPLSELFSGQYLPPYSCSFACIRCRSDTKHCDRPFYFNISKFVQQSLLCLKWNFVITGNYILKYTSVEKGYFIYLFVCMYACLFTDILMIRYSWSSNLDKKLKKKKNTDCVIIRIFFSWHKKSYWFQTFEQ